MELTNRTMELLLRGANMCGTFKEGFVYIVEDLYVGEGEEMREFCEWIDTNVGGAGRANIKQLYFCFNNPNDKGAQEFIEKTKATIASFR